MAVLLLLALAAWTVGEAFSYEAEASTAATILWGLAAVAPLALARRSALAMALLLLVAVYLRFEASAHPHGAVTPLQLLFAAAYAAGRYGGRAAPAAGLLVLCGAIATVLFAEDFSEDPGTGIAFMVIGCSIGWYAGHAVARSSAREQALRHWSEALASEGDARARAVAASERERIAGELRSIVTSAVESLRADAARAEAQLDGDRVAAAAALDAVQRTGREALADMRRLVGLLREQAAPYAPHASGESVLVDAERLRPQPLPGPLDRLPVPVVDVAIVALLALWGVAETVGLPVEGPRGLAIAAAALSPLPLLARRRRPLPVAILVIALIAGRGLAGLLPDEVVSVTPIVGFAAFSVTRYARSTRSAVGGMAFLLACMNGAVASDPPTVVFDFLMVTGIVGGIGVAGHVLRVRHGKAADLTEEGGRLAEASAERARDAAAQERARIARELHDIVGHNMSIISIQAAAAEQTLRTDVEAARPFVAQVRATADETLDELRRLAEILDDGPQRPPALEDIPALVGRARAAGMPVELETQPVDASPGVGLAAYRIVQEALTNVGKHAAAAPSRVSLAGEAGALVVEVVNAPVRGRRGESGGHGLEGMLERARLYGGTLEAGPEPGGGWSVRARLPLETS